MTVTRDGFLDKRILADQPKSGFRAGHDTVLLAAAVPATETEKVLELGAGAGIASLCLAARLACRIVGIEIDADLVALANGNAVLNTMAERVRFETGDAATATPGGAPFDHVFFNPPFHLATGQVSPTPSKDRAKRDKDDALFTWTAHALGLVRPRGTITVILRADRLTAWRKSFDARVVVLPLAAKPGEAPKRVIAQIHPAKSGYDEREPLILHKAGGRSTPEAAADLRHGGPLNLG